MGDLLSWTHFFLGKMSSNYVSVCPRGLPAPSALTPAADDAGIEKTPGEKGRKETELTGARLGSTLGSSTA